MKTALKSIYEEPKLEIAMLLNSDVITTSGAGEGIEDVGSGNNVDQGGWSNGAEW